MVEGENTINRPSRRILGKILLLLIIAWAITFGVYVERQRRELNHRLQQTTAELEEIKKSTERGGEEVAKQIIEKVRKHIDIPTDSQPTVATITDIEKLKAANEFYKAAKNGDYLIITQKRAILYAPDRDIVIDVVPIQIQNTPIPSTAPSSAPSSSRPPLSPTPS